MYDCVYENAWCVQSYSSTAETVATAGVAGCADSSIPCEAVVASPAVAATVSTVASVTASASTTTGVSACVPVASSTGVAAAVTERARFFEMRFGVRARDAVLPLALPRLDRGATRSRSGTGMLLRSNAFLGRVMGAGTSENVVVFSLNLPSRMRRI